MISNHLNKDNLHHAYLIEGDGEVVVKEVIIFIESLDIKTTANPDFSHIKIDTMKIDDARDLKALAGEKSMSGVKRVFLVGVNSILLEAQNTLLKMFEEPIENTIFFMVVPDAGALLKTFVSRFYFISDADNKDLDLKEVEKFISMPLPERLEYIKELLVEEELEDEEGNEMINVNSPKSKALKFLNNLETLVHKNSANNLPVDFFEHIMKVRKVLRMPGSSAKSLMESVALSLPKF